MSLTFSKTDIEGVMIIETDLYQDERGFFKEFYHSNNYKELKETFVQDNHSNSKKGVLRGLHYQLNKPQAKLITAITGEIFDVAVDIRAGSPTFGKWIGIHLSATNKKQFFIPAGFAHGFCVLSDTADVMYKCSELYSSEDEYGLLWSDPDINIDWPLSELIISNKDSTAPELNQIPEELLPVYKK